MTWELSKEEIRKLERTILVNDSGYYFDYLTKNFIEYVVDIKDLKENSESPQVLLYPTKEEVDLNFNKIIKSNCTIFVSNFYVFDSEMVGNYFKFKNLEFTAPTFLEFINFGFEHSTEIESNLIREKDDNYIRFIYVFMKYFELLNNDEQTKRWGGRLRDINPSWFYKVDRSNYEFMITRQHKFKILDFLKNQKGFEKTTKYLGYNHFFAIDIFTKVFFSELQKVEDKEVEVTLLICDYIDQNGKITASKLKEMEKEKGEVIPKAFNELKKQGVVFQLITGEYLPVILSI